MFFEQQFRTAIVAVMLPLVFWDNTKAMLLFSVLIVGFGWFWQVIIHFFGGPSYPVVSLLLGLLTFYLGVLRFVVWTRNRPSA